ncbi:terminase small subunit [Paenibacillus sp. S33]
MAEDKHPGGRPLKFESAEELQAKIDSYFESCYEEVWTREVDGEGKETWTPSLDRHGNVEKHLVKPFTISGLAVHLETDRKTLLNYEDREEFFLTVKRAKARIENFTEETLLTTKNPAGVIFNLKNNYGWQDKQDVGLSGGLNNTNQDLSSLTAEERRARIDELNRRRGNGASTTA